MWIAFSDAFVSAVEDRNDSTRLVVRARNPEHLSRLFPAAEVILTPKADYAARVFISRDEFTRVLVERVAEIEYDNFKSSVSDDRLHRMFENMWAVHHAYQQALSKPDRARHMSWGAGDVQFGQKPD